MISLSAGTLTVRYTKWQDRLCHTIGIVYEDVFVPFLESVEGNADEPWPTSPPMQQMVEESFSPSANPVLLGVGLSGNGHWSTAIETQLAHGLKFDIACKNSKGATRFGSEYRVLAKAERGIEGGAISLQRDTTAGKATVEIAVSIGEIRFLPDEQKIRICPQSDPESIRTHRWCYEVSQRNTP